MKNPISASVMVLICTIAFSFQDANANFFKKNKVPDVKIAQNMHQDFPQAKQITWEEDQGTFEARFNDGATKITAAYDREGNLLSTLIYNPSGYIPFEMKTNLDKRFPHYAVQCMKEFITQTDHNYYFILKNQKKNRENWLSIKSDGNGHFTVLQRLHENI